MKNKILLISLLFALPLVGKSQFAIRVDSVKNNFTNNQLYYISFTKDGWRNTEELIKVYDYTDITKDTSGLYCLGYILPTLKEAENMVSFLKDYKMCSTWNLQQERMRTVLIQYYLTTSNWGNKALHQF